MAQRWDLVPSSRKRRPIDRAIQCDRDARLIVIATEGEKTEPRYFSVLRSTKLQVRTIASEGGKSSPQHVLRNMERFERDFQIGEGDQLWLAIDRDNWEERSLSDVAREAPCAWLVPRAQQSVLRTVACAAL